MVGLSRCADVLQSVLLGKRAGIGGCRNMQKEHSVNILSFSGGKDSTMTAVLMRRLGIPIDAAVFADTGLEFPEMYEFLDVVERKLEIEITRVEAQRKFEDQFYQVRSERSKRQGDIYGWPMTQGCWWNGQGKIQPITQYLKQYKDCVVYVGIGADESDRNGRIIIPSKNKRSLMYELGITGEMAKAELERIGLLNPLYKIFHRLGCYLCPQQRISELRKVRKFYPEQWEHMLEMDKDSPVHFRPDGTTVHDLERRFAIEDLQIEWEFAV